MAVASARPNPWPTIGKLVAALVVTGVLTAGLLLPYVGGLGLAARHEADKFLTTPCNLHESKPPQKTTLFAKDGRTVIATLFSQDRQPVPLSQVPKQLQQALVATEDRRFYSHHGVDMRGLMRSAVSTSGGDTQGGSTLTMQYVKQMRYYQAGKDVKQQQAAIDQNLNRKIEDAKCAIFIENTERESKDKILENYLNIAFFGENSYGIQTAAQTYFGKDVKKLTLPESAMLVGLLRAPTQYDPFGKNPGLAKKRRNEVLQNLVSVGQLSQRDANKYEAQPVSLATTQPPVVKEGCANAPATIKNVGFFCDYAVHWLETVGKISNTQLTTGGLNIVTTLDAGMQNSMQNSLALAMPPTSPMTAVLPAVDPQTGSVRAMATSKIYGTNSSAKDTRHTSLPIFTEYSGQGASTYKLFPLLTALSTGLPTDWPLQTPSQDTGYKPRSCLTADAVKNGDANEQYNINEGLTSATVKSSNTYFVALVDELLQCDLEPVTNMAAKLGMNSLLQPSGDGRLTVKDTILNYQRPGELVLGDVGTSPLELAGAYAAIANNGTFNAPAPIQSITDENGKAIDVRRSPGVQVVAPQVALQAVDILAGDTRFPGTSAQQFQDWYNQGQSVVAGKTGTSVAVDPRSRQDTNKNASLWFVGMTPTLVAATAIVNFDHPNADASGLPGVTDPATQAYGAYAAGVWLKTLGPTLAARPRWTWTPPGAAPGLPVPSIVGMDVATAKTTLAGAGYKLAWLNPATGQQGLCPNKAVAFGKIGYAGPSIAPRGATITACVSSGVQQHFYTAPKPAPTKIKPKPTTPPSRPGGRGGGPSGRPSPPTH
ncbi:MAG: transglycosylase domain-containing protein [Pseudonocardiales bacterium]|nr:penicillin-binding protein [Actinomycetota bacterium]